MLTFWSSHAHSDGTTPDMVSRRSAVVTEKAISGSVGCATLRKLLNCRDEAPRLHRLAEDGIHPQAFSEARQLRLLSLRHHHHAGPTRCTCRSRAQLLQSFYSSSLHIHQDDADIAARENLAGFRRAVGQPHIKAAQL